jgi:CDP-glucose 4,6-dehydratase
MGAEVCGISLDPPTNPSLFFEAKVSNGIRHEIADIRDSDSINTIFQSFCPEIVIHMAAQPLVLKSYNEPIETYSTNIMGTVHVLEACRKSKSVRAIVNVTTDKCYENREWVWGYRETEAMGGYDPYSSSKGCSEIISSAYYRSFLKKEGINLATARAGNVIGGGDWAKNRLIPDILHSFEKNETIEIRNPDSIRPWQHVLEPLSGYLLLAQKLYLNVEDVSSAWNFGPFDNDVKSVSWIAKTLRKKWGSELSLKFQLNGPLHEASLLKLDTSKARQKLGWEPKWSIDTALDKIIDWHKVWIAGGDIREMCLSQINEYSRKVVMQ